MRFLILGFGKFGRLSLKRLLAVGSEVSIIIVDSNEQALIGSFPKSVEVIQSEAITFLTRYRDIDSQDIILPLVPLHVAAGYLLARIPGASLTSLPNMLSQIVPQPFLIGDFNLCCSRADFICPDDCPEGDLCTVTGLPRHPLYEDLEALIVPGFTVRVLRSRQILPGLGGYSFRELQQLVSSMSAGKYLIATACKCHGILTSLAIPKSVVR